MVTFDSIVGNCDFQVNIYCNTAQNCITTGRVKYTVGIHVFSVNLVVEHPWHPMVTLEDTVGNCDLPLNIELRSGNCTKLRN